ncbi:hypothetical protein, partial [Staphylococcus hominis]|uniref:hypothetical protein n=1 Tax=Staphylococcus hominis TaxID=1290 RepID=UPI001643345C
NNPNLELTITYADDSRTSITLPLKHLIPNITRIQLFTVQPHPFPTPKATNNNHFFLINNHQPFTDPTLTSIPNPPHINSTTLRLPQILTP